MNQNQTHKVEIRGGFLWSPKTSRGGRRNPYYDSMTNLSPGDVVFSFFDTFIQAIGVVQSPAITAPKPEFGLAADPWDSVGWLAEVEFWTLDLPFRPREYMQLLSPLLPTKYSPLRASGDGLQNIYLTEISAPFADVLLSLGNTNLSTVLERLSPASLVGDDGPISDALSAANGPRTLEGDLERQQVAFARRGQGVFKHNVRLIETRCRITGLSDPRHLIASHIKPWKYSSNVEKIDGSNGLLLSPHVDHLFDGGFISFLRSGQVLTSPILGRDVVDRWHLDLLSGAGAFTPEQDSYLEYHRDSVLRTSVA